MVIKVQNGVFAPAADESKSTDKKGGEEKGLKNGVVFGGGLQQQWDPVAAKKKQAQKQAMKIWSDAAGAEQKIDKDLEERTAHMDEMRARMNELNAQIGAISDKQAELKEEYGITDETKLSELGERGQEYLGRYLELEKAKGEFKAQFHEANKEFLEEDSIIHGIKLGRLKSHAMADAQKQKDEMMIAASKEAATGMMNEVKEKIDEEQKEQEEKAKEKAEKEEAEEELREAIREKAEGSKDSDDNPALEASETENFIHLESTKTDVKEEVQKMVNEMNLLVEDLKGAAVDKTL